LIGYERADCVIRPVNVKAAIDRGDEQQPFTIAIGEEWRGFRSLECIRNEPHQEHQHHP
jgi:hypothetical protein